MTPGVNKLTIDGISRKWFEETALDISKGEFNFSPARRIEIPKPGDSKKTRPLSISPPREKIIQKAIQLILIDLWDPLFLESNHGFRPNKSTKSALKQLYLNGNHFN